MKGMNSYICINVPRSKEVVVCIYAIYRDGGSEEWITSAFDTIRG
jgi:hypothetical protein